MTRLPMKVGETLMAHRLSLAVVAAAIVVLAACAGNGNTGASVAVASADPEPVPSGAAGPTSDSVTDSSPGRPVRSDVAGSSPSESRSSSVVPSAPTSLGPAPPLACPGAKTGFSRSLSIDYVGAPSPVEAARLYLTEPTSSVRNVSAGAVWAVSGQDPLGVTVTTDSLQLHALQRPDQTWAIDSGEACAELAAPVPTG